jgi:hypothetical protein
MSHLRLVRMVGALLAVAAVAALVAGIATAQSGTHRAAKASVTHVAKASATGCPAPGPGVSGGPAPQSSGGSAALGERVTPGSFSHPGTEQCPPAPGGPRGGAPREIGQSLASPGFDPGGASLGFHARVDCRG